MLTKESKCAATFLANISNLIGCLNVPVELLTAFIGSVTMSLVSLDQVSDQIYLALSIYYLKMIATPYLGSEIMPLKAGFLNHLADKWLL